MVSKLLTHSRFSFKVRMKRSATPLPSGSRTKEGEAKRYVAGIQPQILVWKPGTRRGRAPKKGRRDASHTTSVFNSIDPLPTSSVHRSSRLAGCHACGRLSFI